MLMAVCSSSSTSKGSSEPQSLDRATAACTRMFVSLSCTHSTRAVRSRRDERRVLYFAKVGDHLSEQMDAATSDDLVLCDKTFEEKFEEMRDKMGGCGVVVIVVSLLYLLAYALCRMRHT